MVFSKLESAFAGSPASRIFLPSSVSRKEAARCGDVPAVILANNELSSGSGGGSAGVASAAARDSLTLAWRVGSFASLVGAGLSVLARMSCSRILLSCTNGLRAGSIAAGAGGGMGAGAGAALGAGVELLLLLGGTGIR